MPNTGQSSTISMVIMIVALVAVFYFFMIRPENKKKKKLQEMRDSLSVGDEITTIGGMLGKVVDIAKDTVTFETGEDRVRIQVTKWAISTVGKEKEKEDSSK
jgi:preprotein translocase subunit YajC